VVVTILHCCAGNLYGGIERIVAECAADRDLVPHMLPRFATCFDGRLAGELDASGAGCARLGEVRVSRPQTVVRARRRLGDLVQADRPAAAICHSPWMYGLAAPVLRRAAIPTILWVHDRLSGGTWSERWAALTRPAAIISNSHYTAASISPVFPDLCPAVVYAPVPAPSRITAAERQRIRVTLGVPDTSTCVLLIAARLERWKGHFELLGALAEVPGDWRLWIAGAPQKGGEADYEHVLRSRCTARGFADRVQFLGERRDVPALLQAADVHCQPNTAPEPFGLAFVEALYAELPVVTMDMGGAAEILTRECGVLVQPGDRGALRTALRRLIEDPAARRLLGAAGPRRARALCDPARQLTQLASVVEMVAV
jgi:glycosyltransferase involved in cell wall biosynthesis